MLGISSFCKPVYSTSLVDSFSFLKSFLPLLAGKSKVGNKENLSVAG